MKIYEKNSPEYTKGSCRENEPTVRCTNCDERLDQSKHPLARICNPCLIISHLTARFENRNKSINEYKNSK